MLNIQDYVKIAGNYKLVPLTERFILDTVTPIGIVQGLVKKDEKFFLLESGINNEHLGRYSFLGLEPYAVFSSQAGTNIISGYQATENQGSPFQAMEAYLNSLKVYPLDDGPFCGGAAGFFGYDCVRYIEKIALKTTDLPDSIFLFPGVIVAIDHLKHEVAITIMTFPEADDAEKAYSKAQEKIADLHHQLLQYYPVPELKKVTQKAPQFSEDANYLAGVERIKEHIVAGDVFQTVLSKEFRVPYQDDPFTAYRRLRAENPSPYLFYFRFQDFVLLGSSPEMLVKKNGDVVQTYPIAGTRKRGCQENINQQAELELLADTKEKAEHVMLVDLGRNDLGKVCLPGTVQVKDFMKIEKFSHVMHLVSVVEGLCKENIHPLDVLQAAFPAGTVSGAPKVRAMELIAELESTGRGIYAGAVGYLDFHGNADFCIAIRTLIIKEAVARLRAGAGIVADSDPAKEFAEVIAKASVLFQIIGEDGKNAANY